MKPILKNQTLRIDSHHSGQPVPRYDDPKADIHLDKRSKTGEKGSYIIRIPLNSDRSVTIDGNKGSVPKHIRDEVDNVFKDKRHRDKFVDGLRDMLSNYPNFGKNNDNDVKKVVQRIANAFRLEWSNLLSFSYTESSRRYYAEIYDRNDSRIYFISIDRERILVGDTSRILLDKAILAE